MLGIADEGIRRVKAYKMSAWWDEIGSMAG
jgi:hypothetical protein